MENKKKIILNIDGKKIEAEGGQTILEIGAYLRDLTGPGKTKSQPFGTMNSVCGAA